MPVYADPLMNHGGSKTFRWLSSCHMYADTLDELHAVARKLGLKRAWFQDKRVPHYDLTTRKRARAVGLGVVEHNRRQAVEFWTKKGWHSRVLAEIEFGEKPLPPLNVDATLFPS
jgi:hypothetical protein